MSRSTSEYGYSTDDGLHKQHQRRQNSWNTRNNSSNVSAVLNLELYNSGQGSNFLNGSTKPVVVSNHCYKTRKIPKSHCEECYCKRSPVNPKLTMKLPDQKYGRLKKPKCKFMHMCCIHCTHQENDQEHQDQNHSLTSLQTEALPENKIPESIPTKAASPQGPISKPPETFAKSAIASKQDHVKKPIVASKQDHVKKPAIPSKQDHVNKPIIMSKQEHVSKPVVVSKQNHVNKPIIVSKQDHVSKPIIVSKHDNVKPFHNVKQFQAHEQKTQRTQHQLYEASKSDISDDKNSASISKHIRKKENKLSQVQNSSNFPSTVTTISENEKEGIMESVDVSNVDKTVCLNTKGEENLKKLNTFRQENYFDCHSTGNLPDSKELEEHKCVHKFVLNDRLIPQPLYADVFGTSRCTECDKPIKPEAVHSNNDNPVTKDRTNYQTNVFGKSACCIDRQARYKINISGNSDRIEIKVPISFGTCDDLFNTRFKIKNPASANSLALRHQKGVV